MRVLIAGAGIGGLCLAQGLRRAGIEVAVFERDPAPASRPQGYRIHVDAGGGAALESCLPPELLALYLSTSDRPGERRITTLDHRLTELAAQVLPATRHTAVNRLTLRQILLHGLVDVVRFGHAVTEVSASATGVRIGFANGTFEEGDFLVGADGIDSVVRGFVTPEATLTDIGVRCVYGRTPLPPNGFPGIALNGFTAVLGPGGRRLVLGAFRPATPVVPAGRAAGVELDPVGDYLMWCVLSDVDFLDRDAATLHKQASELVDGWHPVLRRILAEADVPATFPIAIRTSSRVPAWPTTNVTVLGDAIHAMTPAGGAGANTALRDAAALAAALSSSDVHTALHQYEHDMREYGFDAVERSLRGMS